MDSRYKHLGINAILVFFGKLGSGLITFLMLPLYTRWLGPEQFGEAELVNTYSNIIFSLATCCMAEAIFIFPKTSDLIGKCKYFSSGFLIALIGVFLSFLLSFVFKLDYFSIFGTFSSNSVQIALLSSCLFLQNYTQQFTRSIDKMKVYSISGIVLSSAIALYAFLFIPIWGSEGYIYSLSLANISAAIYTFCASRSFRYLSFSYFDRSFAFDLLKYGIPLIPNTVMWWLVDGINRPIMEAELGLAAIGIYSVASKFPSVLNVITGAFSNAWGISVSEEYNKNNFNMFFNQVFEIVFFVLMLFSFLLATFSTLIINIFTSGNYHDASKLFPILLLSVMLSNASGLFGGIFMARKQSRYFFYSSVYGAITSLIFTLFFIKIWGVYGVAWASVLSFLTMAVARAYFVWADISRINIMYYVVSLILYVVFVITKISDYYLLQCVLLPLTLALFLLLNKKNVILIYSKFSNSIKR